MTPEPLSENQLNTFSHRRRQVGDGRPLATAPANLLLVAPGALPIPGPVKPILDGTAYNAAPNILLIQAEPIEGYALLPMATLTVKDPHIGQAG